MATRIGKYKMTKQEEAYSLSDGNNFVSTLSSAGAATFSGIVKAVGLVTAEGNITNAGATTTHGAGAIGTEIAPSTTVTTMNDQIITTIKLDLTGLKSYNDDGDIIGKDATDGAYLLQYDSSVHGILHKTEISCLELPTASSNVNIDFDLALIAAADGAGNDDANAGVIHTGGGNIAKGQTTVDLIASIADGSAITSGHYLYLITGNTHTGASVYTAGKLIIRLFGHKTF